MINLFVMYIVKATELFISICFGLSSLNIMQKLKCKVFFNSCQVEKILMEFSGHQEKLTVNSGQTLLMLIQS